MTNGINDTQGVEQRYSAYFSRTDPFELTPNEIEERSNWRVKAPCQECGRSTFDILCDQCDAIKTFFRDVDDPNSDPSELAERERLLGIRPSDWSANAERVRLEREARYAPDSF
jgi:hypothetical protein